MLSSLPYLEPPIPWKDCKSEFDPPTQWQVILDPGHKRFVSHWLWKARQTREALENNPNFPDKFRAEDKERLERDYRLVLKEYANYQAKIAMKNRKEARLHALEIKAYADSFRGVARASASTAHLLAQTRASLDSAREPPGWTTLLNEANMEATILVYGKRRALQCSVGYREDAIYAIINWLNRCFKTDYQQKRVFWLHGENNCGKSVIAHYLATQLNKQGALAAGYIFHPDFNEAKLSGLIANFIDEFMDHIGDAFLQRQLWDVLRNLRIPVEKFRKLPVASQFEKLLAPAWKSLDWEQQKPMVVVLDDLDRCDNVAIYHVFDLIQTSISDQWKLPIYWIVSSCATPDIENRMRVTLGDTVQEYDLPVYDPTRDPVTPIYRPPTPPTPTDAQSFHTAWEPPDTPRSHRFFPDGEDTDEEFELEDPIQISSIQGALLAPDAAMSRR